MIQIPKDSIESINIGGLNGRMLKLDTKGNKDIDILMVYGVHSSLERMYTTAKFHSNYGRVWLPDLPGFGGMDSFYKIGRCPSLDSYADYLYTLVRAYKLDEKRLRIFAMSFGFLIVTRMLQKYPDVAGSVDFVISFVGFGKTDDFSIKTFSRPWTKPLLKLASTRFVSALVSKLIFNKVSLRVLFALFRVFNSNPKYKPPSKEEQKKAIEMELELWTKNDARTKFFTYLVLADFDLTKQKKLVPLKLYDMTTPSDQYFDSKSVNKTLAKLYKATKSYKANLEVHAPSVVGDEETVARVYPESIKKVLSQ